MTMYTVLIVEDEKPAREVFKLLISSRPERFEIVGEASNGRDGLALYEELQPDFLVTDITMPIMSGLELLEEIRSRQLKMPQTIILSCHQDFHYAQKAMGLGAASYLLKDDCLANETLLTDTMISLISFIQNENDRKIKQEELEQKIRKNKLEIDRNLFLDTVKGEDTDWGAYLQQSGYPTHLGKHALIYVEMNRSSLKFRMDQSKDSRLWQFAGVNLLEELLQDYGFVQVVAIEEEKFIALFPYDREMDQVLQKIEQGFETYLKIICYSLCVFDLSIKQLGDTARSLIHTGAVFFYEQQIMCEHSLAHLQFEPVPEPAAVKLVEQIKQLFIEGRVDDLEAWKLVHSECIKLRWNPGHVKAIYISSISEFYNLNHMKEQKDMHALKKLFLKIEDSQTFAALQDAIYQQFKKWNGNQLQRNVIESAVATAILKIKSDLTVNYSLEEMAVFTGYSTPYFSQMFRKLTGKTYTQFMTSLRIEKAKFIFSNTDLKTYEVAEQVGLGNYRHFNKIFKREVGVNPSEYRQSLKRLSR